MIVDDVEKSELPGIRTFQNEWFNVVILNYIYILSNDMFSYTIVKRKRTQTLSHFRTGHHAHLWNCHWPENQELSNILTRFWSVKSESLFIFLVSLHDMQEKRKLILGRWIMSTNRGSKVFMKPSVWEIQKKCTDRRRVINRQTLQIGVVTSVKYPRSSLLISCPFQ